MGSVRARVVRRMIDVADERHNRDELLESVRVLAAMTRTLPRWVGAVCISPSECESICSVMPRSVLLA
jgi:hypothetical protein